MLTFIDISNHQKGINLTKVLNSCDAVIVKATEGLDFVDPYCDIFVEQVIRNKKPWGFYHFARKNNATAEADYFYKNTKNYFKSGIPILDWEDGQSITWVNEFVERIHKLTGIWCWVYGNNWRFNAGTVNENCMRWVCGYPGTINTFDAAKETKCPYPINNGVLGAWQFTSSGRLSGYSSNLDMNVFYGDEKAWSAYVGEEESRVSIEQVDNGVYRLYNPNGKHLFTPNHNEAETLANAGWNYEGIMGISGNDKEVYRLYNPTNGDHLLTTSTLESIKAQLFSGYKLESESFKSGTKNAVYRVYNKYTGEHFYTTDLEEKRSLCSAGWTEEGIAFRMD